MGLYPQVDPIPLPGPVWLFKVLHLFTTTLHFAAVQLLLGGLILGVVWAWMARARKGSGPYAAVADAIVRPLPVIMTYVINLGVPPLLFTQVLYGRCLYTSSVLIGTWWIAVIGLVMTTYFLLYHAEASARKGGLALWSRVAALACALVVALIYVSNMTLMIRPEAWRAMYDASPSGLRLPSGDPTMHARWAFMVASALATTGAYLALLARGRPVDVARHMSLAGGRLAAGGAVVAALAFAGVFLTQPAEVRDGLLAGGYTKLAMVAWGAGLAVVAGAGLACSAKPEASGWGMPSIAAIGAYLSIVGWVIVRDAIRDVTLRGKAYEVADRTVVSNWGVIGLFLFLLVVGLGLIAWMVVALARGRKDAVASHA